MNIEDFQNKKKIFFSYYPGDVDNINNYKLYNKIMIKFFFNHDAKLINNDKFYNNIIFEKYLDYKKNFNFLLILYYRSLSKFSL